MNKLTLTTMVLALAVVGSNIALASPFYVARDRSGEVAVTNGEPRMGWTVEQGPFSTKDAAQRASGTEFSPRANGSQLDFPSVNRRGLGYDNKGFFVISNRSGEKAVITGRPGIGWNVEQGPFGTKDEAQRAMGAEFSPRTRGAQLDFPR